MARLLRPYIPLEVRCRVAMRQLGEMWPDRVIAEWNGPMLALLDELIVKLMPLLSDAEIIEYHLDHNPPLAVRKKVFCKGVHVGYKPAANDPEFLIYREANAHRIKTNHHGDGAQHPDRVLIKKARRLERTKPKRGPPIKSKKSTWPQGRKIQSRKAWPTKQPRG